jgi:hypothetical protein
MKGWSTETSIARLVCRTLEDAIIAASLKAKAEIHPETYLTARLRRDGVFIEMPQKTRVGVVEVKVPCPNATAALEDEVVLGQIMAYLLALLYADTNSFVRDTMIHNTNFVCVGTLKGWAGLLDWCRRTLVGALLE